MKIYEVGSYPGKTSEISVTKNQDLMPKIKEKLKEESSLSEERINGLQIVAGIIVTKEQCCIKINNSGWIPLLKENEYFTISFDDVLIKKIEFSENVTLKTFAYYFL